MSLKQQKRFAFLREFRLGLVSDYCTPGVCSVYLLVFLKDHGLLVPYCETIVALPSLSRQAFLDIQGL